MDVSRVDYDIATGEFSRNPVLVAAMECRYIERKSTHLMGLISDGQVHSSLEHLYALLRMAKEIGLEKVFIHCFLGRTRHAPASATHYIAELQKKIDEVGAADSFGRWTLLRDGSRQTDGNEHSERMTCWSTP
jgi:2,3-bisphosphoglycerate-independent phosphoglycerate mutase